MKLNPFENSRTFYSRSKGITKTVRDTFTNQSTKKVEEVKKVNFKYTPVQSRERKNNDYEFSFIEIFLSLMDRNVIN